MVVDYHFLSKLCSGTRYSAPHSCGVPQAHVDATPTVERVMFKQHMRSSRTRYAPTQLGHEYRQNRAVLSSAHSLSAHSLLGAGIEAAAAAQRATIIGATVGNRVIFISICPLVGSMQQ